MFLVEVNSGRIKKLAELLSPHRNLLETLYRRDPQYVAVQGLLRARKCEETCILTLLNALVSYQLSMPGEQYWFIFARYFSENTSRDLYSLFESFLRTYSPRLLSQKLSRIKRVLSSELILELQRDPFKYCRNTAELARKLASVLETEDLSKTVLFAVKMYGYVCDLCGIKPEYVDLKIPLDFRNALIALASCIISIKGVNITSVNIYKYAKLLTSQKHSNLVQSALSELCRELKIPCIHLDTFTWLFTGIVIRSNCNFEKARSHLKEVLGVDLPRDLILELTRCWCTCSVS